MIVAIIPARGGSKGIPRKNVKDIAGKPLIAWSIEHALNSKLIDEVYVTTEDREIAEIAYEFGAKIINRPKELATDTISSIPAIKHAIDNIDEDIEYYVLLQPTSPIRSKDLIDNCIRYIKKYNANCLVTYINKFIIDIGRDVRRQDIEKKKEWDGNVYVGKPELLKNNTIYGDRILKVLNSQAENIEIDTKLDFFIAEKILEDYDYEKM